MALYEGNTSIEANASLSAEPSLICSASTSLFGQAGAQGFFPGNSYNKLIGWWAADSLSNSVLSGDFLERWEDLSPTDNDFLKTEDQTRPVLERDTSRSLNYFDFRGSVMQTENPYLLEGVSPVSFVFLARFKNTDSVETLWSFIQNVEAGVQKDGISVDVALVGSKRVQVHYGNDDTNTFFGATRDKEWVAVAVTPSFLRWGSQINRNGSSQVSFHPTYATLQEEVKGALGLLNNSEGLFDADLSELLMFEGELGLYEARLVQDYLINKAKTAIDIEGTASLNPSPGGVIEASVSWKATSSLTVYPLHSAIDTSDLIHWYTATDPTDTSKEFDERLFQWKDVALDGGNPLVGVLPQEGNPIWKENDIGIGNSVAFTEHSRSYNSYMASLGNEFTSLIQNQSSNSLPQISFSPPAVSDPEIPGRETLNIMILTLPDCVESKRLLLTVGNGSFEREPYSLRVWLQANCDDRSLDDLVVELNGSYARSDLYATCGERSISPDPYDALYKKVTYEQIRERNRDPVLITLALEENNITTYVHDGGLTTYASPDSEEGDYGQYFPEKGGRIWIGSGNSCQTNDSKYGELIFWKKILPSLERETVWNWIFGRYGTI